MLRLSCELFFGRFDRAVLAQEARHALAARPLCKSPRERGEPVVVRCIVVGEIGVSAGLK